MSISKYTSENNLKFNLPPDFGLHRYEDNKKYIDSIMNNDDPYLYVQIKLNKGKVKAESIRSTYWMIALDCVEIKEDCPLQSFLQSLRSARQKYENLKNSYGLNSNNENNRTESVESDNSIEELEEEIEKDIDRLFPTGCEDFFEQKSVRGTITHILTVWCLEHPVLRYRQGMHEILAPIYYITERDKLFNYKITNNNNNGNSNENDEIYEIFNPKYVEHDSFILFDNLMKHLSVLYDNNEMFDHEISDDNLPLILRMCNKISELIEYYSPDLMIRFKKEHFDLRMFILRWARLMFAREFNIDVVLRLWDYTFGNLSKKKYLLSELIEAECTTFILIQQPNLLMSNLCNIIQTLNEYQLDIPIDFIYQQSKLVLKKKPLEFLAKVIVPKSIADQQLLPIPQPQQQQQPQQSSQNKPKIVREKASSLPTLQPIQPPPQQQEQNKDNSQLSSFSFLSFLSSLTGSNANTPKSVENTPKKVNSNTKPPLYKQSPLVKQKKVLSNSSPQQQPINEIRKIPSLPKLNHKDYTYNKRMAIRLDFVCNLITDEWTKILELIPENTNIDAVPMSKAIKTLTKVQYVMNNRISEEDAFEEEEKGGDLSTNNQQTKEAAPAPPPPLTTAINQTEEVGKEEKSECDIKRLSFDSSPSENSENSVKSEKSEKEEENKPSTEKRGRFISEELREALFDTPSSGLFDDSVDSNE